MPAYIKELHDVGILRSDGSTTVPLMLARDPTTRQPVYRTNYEDYFVNRAYATALDYGATDPQSELRMIYSDWRRGFGQYIFDSDDPKRYYSSIGCDLRQKGMAIAGPIATAITPPAYPACITNSGFEIYAATEFTGWTKPAGTGTPVWTQSTAVVDTGTYSAKVAFAAAGAATIYQTFTGANWNNNYRAKEITVTCRGYTNAATTSVIVTIADGDGADTVSNAVTGTAWATATVTRTIGAAATYLTVTITITNSAATNASAYIDSVSSDIPYAGAIVTRAEFNDLQYLAGGNIVWKLDATAAALTFVDALQTGLGVDATTAITDMEIFGAYLFIARASAPCIYMTTAEAFTTSTLTDGATLPNFKFFCTVYSATTTLWGSDGANTIRSTTNPINGGTNWSAQTTVGASYHEITDMIQKNGALYIMKENMPYYLSSAGAVQNNLAPECASMTSSTSGKGVIEWLKNLYFPVGATGLMETDGTTNTWRNPGTYCTNLADFVGRVQALASDEEWLFAIVDNDTKVEVIAMRDENIDGSVDWVEHPFCEITMAGCEAAWVSSVYQKRLWITSTTAGAAIYYIPLPTGYGNITADANRTFKTDPGDQSVYFIIPFLHGGFRGDTKRWIKVVATLGHTYAAGIYWSCWYRKLQDSGWTDAGDFVGTAPSRIATLYIPVDGSSAKPTSTMMQFKMVPITNSTTTTPILLDFDVRAILFPTIREIIECEVVAGDFIHDKKGNLLDGVSAATVKTVLEEARDSVEPFSFYDPWGATVTCRLLPTSPFSFVTYGKKDENLEQHFVLRLQKVALS